MPLKLMNRIEKLLFSALVTLILSSFFVKYVLATELFQDNFNSASDTLSKWTIVGPSIWQTLNGEFGVSIDSGVTNAVPSDSYWNSSWENFIFTVDLKGLQGTDKNVLIKYKDENNFYEIHHSGGYIFFEKTINGSGYTIAPKVNYQLNNGSTYHFKIEVNGDHYLISESNNILFDTNNTGVTFSGGKPGLRVGVGATHPSEVWYDNVVIMI